MTRKRIIIFITLIISSFLIFIHTKISGEISRDPYVPITIHHWQYFDSTKSILISNDKKGIASGDFRWEATNYQHGGIGSINSKFMISMHPPKFITVSRLKKIQNADFDSISRKTCNEIKYDQADFFSRVNDNDIFCISRDKNRDHVYGDDYVKLKIVSHKDADNGNYADYITFLYEVL